MLTLFSLFHFVFELKKKLWKRCKKENINKYKKKKRFRLPNENENAYARVLNDFNFRPDWAVWGTNQTS